MTKAEYVIALTFLFALVLTLAGLREGRVHLLHLRALLLINAALGMVGGLAGGLFSFRGMIFYLVLAVGGTECGFWVGKGLNAMIGVRREGEFEAATWGVKTDPIGCSVTLIIGVIFLALLTYGGSFDSPD